MHSHPRTWREGGSVERAGNSETTIWLQRDTSSSYSRRRQVCSGERFKFVTKKNPLKYENRKWDVFTSSLSDVSCLSLYLDTITSSPDASLSNWTGRVLSFSYCLSHCYFAHRCSRRAHYIEGGSFHQYEKKDSNVTLQVQPPQKNKQNQKSPRLSNQVFLSGVGMKPAYTFPELCNH